MGIRQPRAALAVLLWLALTALSWSQELGFANYRKIEPPEGAVLRIGPFHSTLSLRDSLAYRYVGQNGPAASAARGQGSEFPITISLDSENYLVVSPYVGVNATFAAGYDYFPLETEDNDFRLSVPDERVYGDFGVNLAPTENLRARLYDEPAYYSAYIDYRGLEDYVTGSKYERFQNTVGLETDWLMARDKNLALDLTREDVLPQGDEFAQDEHNKHSASLAFEYQANPNLVIRPTVEYNVSAYSGREGLDSFLETAVAADGRLTPETTCRARLGYSMNDSGSSESGTGGGSSQTVGEFGLEQALNRWMRHSASYSRTFSSGFGGTAQVLDQFDYGFQWQAGLANVGISMSVQESHTAEDTGSDYRTWEAQASLGYPLGKGIDMRLSSGYDLRESLAEEAVVSDYGDWTTTLTLGFQVAKDVSFELRAEHLARDSQDETLRLEQDELEIRLNHSYQF